MAAYKLIVQKFGGTSVEDARAMSRSIKIVRDYGVGPRTRALVVLSACSGVTNELIRLSELSIKSDLHPAQATIDRLEARHARIARELLPEGEVFDAVHGSLHSLWESVRLLARGVHLLGELTPRNRDQFESVGERASTLIFQAALSVAMRDKSIPVHLFDAREFFVTSGEFTAARPLLSETTRHIKKVAQELASGAIGVTQGFIGATIEGETTTIGRGGSDFSAAIMGVALAAHAKVPEIQIWTDVAGILTCDPRLVRGTRSIERISFQDASELAYFGAKVLHPETIWPAVEKGIPVRVLSSKEPKKPGTTITTKASNSHPITGIALLRDVIAVRLGLSSIVQEAGVQQAIWDTLGETGATPVAVAFSVGSALYVFRDASPITALRAAMEGRTKIEVESGRSLITLVGPGLREHAGIAARIFRSLGRTNCEMISYGGSDRSINFLVDSDAAQGVLRKIHGEFF
ncbi:MAG: aspartate kinase [Bacteroidota bacterium]|nr:aspartate kinase [Bacteroidota bacterium]MDP4234316.1 aspartate kinase [Bacteroidota bacterium]MDP4243250.1 aspartate kinase [Bacteroidota bacterium]MDP4288043.1 aspartate kinase [Bacteroidota bacterium]